MNTYVALFRGINVAGRHILPMKDLKLVLEQQGCLNVGTYIQSGNAIFRTARTEKLLGVEATARNWHTIAMLIQMAGEAPRK